MELQLKRIRESQGIKQPEMAQRVSESMGEEIKTRTYGSWERQEVTINIEQAYNCCLVLGCTLNDLVGMKRPDEMARAPGEGELIDCYRAADGRGRDAIMSAARHERDAAEGKGGMQGGPVSRTA